jgi:trehalose 6-phosphate synthase/phosphatase
VHRNLEDWYPTAEKIMGHYAERTPRSIVEKKNFSLAWHYRQSPREYGALQAKKLAEELELGLANQPVTILRGKKLIEVRAAEADKGAFVSWYLDQTTTDTYAFAFGDDLTDEDMFKALKDRGVSVKVGFGKTSADFRVRTQDSVLRYFNRLCNAIDELMRLTHRTPDLQIEEKAADAGASLRTDQPQRATTGSGEPTTLIASRTIARPLLHDRLED